VNENIRFMMYLLIIIILFGLFLTPSVVGAAESLSNYTVIVLGITRKKPR